MLRKGVIPIPPARNTAARFGIRNEGRPADKWLADTARWTGLGQRGIRQSVHRVAAL